MTVMTMMMSYSFKYFMDFFLSIILEKILKRQKSSSPQTPNTQFPSWVKFIIAYKTSKRSTILKCDQNNRLYSTKSKLLLSRRFPHLTWKINQAGMSWFQHLSTMLMIFSCWINRIEMFVISAAVGNSGRASTNTLTALCPSHGCV